MQILVAEDDMTSRMALSGLLEAEGDEVIEVEDGENAFQKLQSPAGPQLAVLDWMMPVMDGIDVVKRIHSSGEPELPYIILLTAKTAREDLVSALDAGADDFLSKPFDSRELVARVRVGKRMLKLQQDLRKNVNELQQAVQEIRTLRGIVPICAGCKKIRDDKGYWNQVEVYIGKHTEAEFSHSLCPDCIRRYYPEVKLTGAGDE